MRQTADYSGRGSHVQNLRINNGTEPNRALDTL